jgi:hypothetical protein
MKLVSVVLFFALTQVVPTLAGKKGFNYSNR